MSVVPSACESARIEWIHLYEPISELAGGATEAPRRLLVLIADCVYWPELFAPLADTLCSLCAERDAVVLMAHTRRWKRDGQFFKMLVKKGLEVRKIDETVERCATGAGREERASSNTTSTEGGDGDDEDEQQGLVAGDTRRVVTRVYRIAASTHGVK